MLITGTGKAALLALEDGSIFRGISVGVNGHCVGEVIFNTSMTGYQEIITDPSYTRQIITFTYPHIGNVGVNSEDCESDRVWAAGLVLRNLPLLANNWRMEHSLSDYLQINHIIAIANVDTRRLTRIIREKGALNGCIMAGDVDEVEALNLAQNFLGISHLNLIEEATTKRPYTWDEGAGAWHLNCPSLVKKNWKVIVYDFGVKHNILKTLTNMGCLVIVVPSYTTADKILAMKPDGIILSNGPGDPRLCTSVIDTIQKLLVANIPLFGICLGHQLLAIACGAKIFKMKFGHHGANHPVKQLINQKVMISTQNHGFAVDSTLLPTTLLTTHYSLFDNSIQGFRHVQFPAFGFQGHPEANPGPKDLNYLFIHFVELMHIHQHSLKVTSKQEFS